MSDIKKPFLAATLSLILMFAGCADAVPNEQGSSGTQTTTASDSQSETQNEEEADGDDEAWKSNTGTITLGSEITFTGGGVSVDGSVVSITSGGDFTVSGTLEDGMILVNTGEKVKLRLNGVDITNSSGPAIFFLNSKKSFITLSEGSENFLTDASSYTVDAKGTLFSNDTLEIKGAGSLTVTGNYKHAISSDDDIIIEEGTLILKAVKNGIKANDNITVNGGDIKVTSSNDGLNCEGDIIINAGVFEISAGDDAIHADTALTVNDGDINITSCYEGLEAKSVLTINSGNIRAICSDDGLNACADIIINGGYLFLDTGGDGIDSNGSLTINAGTVVIYSGNNANGPLDIDDRNGVYTINGGTVIAAGGNMGISVSEESSQYSLWISKDISAGTLINVSLEDGEEIVSFELLKIESLIYISTPSLTSGGTYNISTGGDHTGQSVDGLYAGGAYSGGSMLGSVTLSAKSASLGNAGGGMGGFGQTGGKGGFGGRR